MLILLLNLGIRRLIADGTYLAAYPLHEVTNHFISQHPFITSFRKCLTVAQLLEMVIFVVLRVSL